MVCVSVKASSDRTDVLTLHKRAFLMLFLNRNKGMCKTEAAYFGFSKHSTASLAVHLHPAWRNAHAAVFGVFFVLFRCNIWISHPDIPRNLTAWYNLRPLKFNFTICELRKKAFKYAAPYFCKNLKEKKLILAELVLLDTFKALDNLVTLF